MSKIMQEEKEALAKALADSLPEKEIDALTKKAQSFADDIAQSVEWYIKDNLADNLAYHVKDMATRAVEALLDGNESEMKRWLSCDTSGYTGRSDGYGKRTIEDQHPVIHGKLHLAKCVELRRSIAEAHKDLIQNERIKDLEDIVASLVAQINKQRGTRSLHGENT